MNRTAFRMIACAAVAGLVAACASAPAGPKPPPAPPVVDRPGAKLVTVTESQTGASVTNLRDVRHGGITVVGDTSLKLFTVHIVDKDKPLYEYVN